MHALGHYRSGDHVRPSARNGNARCAGVGGGGTRTGRKTCTRFN